MPNNSNKITILYLSFGSGHQVAAESVAAAIQRENPNISLRVIDPFANYIETLPAVLDRLQALSISLIPSIYDTLWRRGTAGSLYERITDLGIFQDLLKDEIQAHQVKVVVATHVMATAMTIPLKREYNIEKVFGVVTDFGLNSYWPLREVDGYFVAHEELKNTLIYRGCRPDVIYPTGIPIKLSFESLESHPYKRAQKPLNVLLIAGGLRSGAYIEVKNRFFKLLDALNQFDATQLNLTVITGNQEKLFRALLEKKDSYPFEIVPLGFTENMQYYLSTHDIVITKPGGLIISECLACGTPMILFQTGPGQEQANVEFLARHGIALNGTNPEDVANAIQVCLEEPSRLTTMANRAKNLGRPNAAKQIARHILELSGMKA